VRLVLNVGRADEPDDEPPRRQHEADEGEVHALRACDAREELARERGPGRRKLELGPSRHASGARQAAEAQRKVGGARRLSQRRMPHDTSSRCGMAGRQKQSTFTILMAGTNGRGTARKRRRMTLRTRIGSRRAVCVACWVVCLHLAPAGTLRSASARAGSTR
jgi:hypothetical protein